MTPFESEELTTVIEEEGKRARQFRMVRLS
jgi:hypothetical protein